MTTEAELLKLERGFWTGGADYYRRHVDDTCLLAFTEQAGIMPAEAVAASVGDRPAWEHIQMDVRGLTTPCDGLALLTYKVHARRAGGEPYSGVVSSGYARRGDEWKLVFHQQTPLGLERRPSTDYEVEGREPQGVGTHLGIDRP